jgi:ATP phosphoribosyltransferase involved in histidine biosynthesis
VVKSKSSKVLRSRTTIQVGAEIFGDSSKNAELESISLMLDSLEVAEVENITLSLGHAGLTASILQPFKKLGVEVFSNVEMALSKKSKSDLNNIISNDHKNKSSLLALCDMYGTPEILGKAKDEFSYIEQSASYLEHLNSIVEDIDKKTEVNIHIDLGEIQGFKYHNGIVFSAYSDLASYVLAKGGRYDGLRKSSDHDRPAVGFDLDLIAVSNL